LNTQVRRVRSLSHRSRFPHRGAEDREERHEEQDRQELNMKILFLCLVDDLVEKMMKKCPAHAFFPGLF
jgi:hypothetical protein